MPAHEVRDDRDPAGRRRGRPWLLAAAATAALALAAAAVPGPGGGAAAQELGPPKRVNGGRSPFAGCRADRAARQTGDLYRNAEIEPWVASNPADPRNLVAVWQQDRWSNGGARGNAGAFSRDGGLTWRTVVPRGVTLCTGGEYDRASDPWVDFSPGGAAYFMHLAFDQDLPTGGFGPNAMLVSRSTDGGATYGRPIALIRDTNPQVLNDKNSLTADPDDPRLVYAVWDRLQDFTIDPETGAAPAGGKTGGGAAGARTRAKLLRQGAAKAGGQAAGEPELIFKGPAFLARTTDGGRSWEPAREIYDPGDNAQTIGNQVLVAPDGTVIDFFTEITQEFVRVALLRSTDKGRTFERRPRAVGDIVFTDLATITPDAREPVRDAQILFDVAVDVATGTLHAVWQDARFRGVEEVAYAASRDGGATWSRPVRINKTPADPANRLRQQAFVPSIEAGPGGVLVVTYYDFRNDRRGPEEELTDHWAVFCEIGEDAPDCTDASRWGGELRLTRSSFDMLDAPVARGHFVGDYVGLERAGDAVVPVFGVATGDDLTDLLARRIVFPGGRLAAAGR